MTPTPLSRTGAAWAAVHLDPEPHALHGFTLADLLNRQRATAERHGVAFRAVRVECNLGLRETAAGFGISAVEVSALERGERVFRTIADFKAALDQLWTWSAERNPEALR
jgi:hypothetical protein